MAGRVLAGLWQEQASSWWDLRTPEEEAFWTRYGEGLGARLGLGVEQAAQVLAAFPYERYLRPVEGAREVLAGLRARGLRIGVLSNTLPSIDRTLRALGLDDLVDVAVASCTVGAHKPEARAFTSALERLGLPAGAVLFVDDRPENVEAARALGMRAVQIDLCGRVPGALHRLRDVLAVVDGPVPA
ncbi:HAD family hydrolase [Deinococcus aerius]|uniref:HAD family hydrolase n=1 Tax=Deinococcus aerius TaxID=200253 RepID=A0A2I9CX16_9DEIO|nr:HAD family hydrolase [Deinococcus aerius]